MGLLDYAIVIIIALSGVVGIVRGFFKEALSLATWICAFWFSYEWAETFAVYFSDAVSISWVRWLITFALLFIAVHICGFVISRLIMLLVKPIGLSGVNRIAGGGFGIARGVVLVAVAIFFIRPTFVSKYDGWQESLMIAAFNDGLDKAQVLYPFTVSETLVQTSE